MTSPTCRSRRDDTACDWKEPDSDLFGGRRGTRCNTLTTRRLDRLSTLRDGQGRKIRTNPLEPSTFVGRRRCVEVSYVAGHKDFVLLCKRARAFHVGIQIRLFLLIPHHICSPAKLTLRLPSTPASSASKGQGGPDWLSKTAQLLIPITELIFLVLKEPQRPSACQMM